VNSDGADTWMDPDVYAASARFGAPPDDLGPQGQDWGLPPLNPHTLRQRAYEPFIAMLRANMRHAGALRIDHAMALQHLFWIPPGHQAVDGIYVTYPLDDLMGIVALESHRNQCVVIGEDLGTVPPGFRERMAAENILSYRILYFERWENGLLHRPDIYPPLALATASSHDMAPVAGHWEAWDVHLRHKLGLARPDATEAEDLKARAADRAILIGALQDQNLLPTDFPATTVPLADSDMRALVLACHQFLARTPSRLMLMNLDDLVCETSQVNVPGTVDQYPNWSRRLRIDIETLVTSDTLRTTTEAITRERGR
jgi:4-alpha-glucanotransferase